MPAFSEIAVLSGSEDGDVARRPCEASGSEGDDDVPRPCGPEALDRSRPPETTRKRKRSSSTRPSEKKTEGFLRKHLARKCVCRRGTCFTQFLEPAAFASLQQHRSYFLDLQKLDQDQCVL